MDNLQICDPKEREDMIFLGLKVYIRSCLGEYLTSRQMDMIADILRKFRTRPADVDFSNSYCCVISEEPVLRNILMPRKTLRKAECAIFFYNVGPYAIISRRHTARLAKHLFPKFFATERAIDSYFTLHSGVQGKDQGRESGLSITNLPNHTTAHVERIFYELGHNSKHKTNGRK